MKRNIFVFSCFAHSWRKKRILESINVGRDEYLRRCSLISIVVCTKVCLFVSVYRGCWNTHPLSQNVTILFNCFYKACFAFCTFLKSSDISGVDAKVHSMWSCSFCRTWSDLRVHTEGWGNMQLMNLFYGNRLVFYALSFQCGPDKFVPQEIFIHFMFLWQFAATLVLSLDFHL